MRNRPKFDMLWQCWHQWHQTPLFLSCHVSKCDELIAVVFMNSEEFRALFSLLLWSWKREAWTLFYISHFVFHRGKNFKQFWNQSETIFYVLKSWWTIGIILSLKSGDAFSLCCKSSCGGDKIKITPTWWSNILVIHHHVYICLVNWPQFPKMTISCHGCSGNETMVSGNKNGW